MSARPPVRMSACPSVGLLLAPPPLGQVFVRVDSALSMDVHCLCPFDASPAAQQALLEIHDQTSHNSGGNGSAGAAAHAPERPRPRRPPWSPFTLSVNASRAWLKHVRGAGMEDTDAAPRERVLCSSTTGGGGGGGGRDDDGSACREMGEGNKVKLLAGVFSAAAAGARARGADNDFDDPAAAAAATAAAVPALQCHHSGGEGGEQRGRSRAAVAVNPADAWAHEAPFVAAAARMGDVFAGAYERREGGRAGPVVIGVGAAAHPEGLILS